jgi:hypothetical protein
MATKYTKISAGRKAKIVDGALYVMQTNMQYGMLEQGGYVGRTYQIPYDGTLEDALKTNEHGISDIDRCIESGKIVHVGRIIQ